MRTFALLLAGLIASLALASSASASESVSVVTEPGNEPCTVDDCHTGIESVGNVELRGHLFGIETHSQDCHTGAMVHVRSDGSGHVTSVAFTPGDSSCNSITACDTPWPFTGEETGANTARMNVDLCVDGTPLGRCSGTAALLGTEPTNHRYAGSVSDGVLAGESFGKCEVTGSWQQVAPIGAFEIVHQ